MALFLVIDAFRLIAEPLTSGAIYVSELVKSLSALPEIGKLNLLLPSKPGDNFIYHELMELKNIEFIYPPDYIFPERNFQSQIYWIQRVILRLIRTEASSIDYYIAPYHHPPIFLSKKIRVVTVIHDLCGLRADCGYVKTKKGFYQHLFMFLMASFRSDLLIPISEYTKKQLHRSFPFLSSRISNVVYNGVSCKPVEASVVNETLQKFALSQKQYFLGFGAPGVRKGLDLMLDAYGMYREHGGQASLVLIVANQYRGSIRQLIYARRLRDVILLSDLEAFERDALYRRALALLFLSRCEGFGYPLVEGMRQGCPPIAYQEGPASEIVSSVLPLLTKLDTDEIVRHMLTFATLNSCARAELTGRLIRRSLLFTSDKFGQNFLEAMKRCEITPVANQESVDDRYGGYH